MARMLGKPIKSKLSDAMENAHRLTAALRERGIPAYEYHDRYTSTVCVGSFDDLTVIGRDGRQQWNPDLVNVIQNFQPRELDAAVRDSRGKVHNGAIKPFTLPGLEDVPFDTVPEPIEVPRYSVANDYARDNREFR